MLKHDFEYYKIIVMSDSSEFLGILNNVNGLRKNRLETNFSLGNYHINNYQYSLEKIRIIAEQYHILVVFFAESDKLELGKLISIARKFNEKLQILLIKDCPDTTERTAIDSFYDFDINGVLYKKFNLNDAYAKIISFHTQFLQLICGTLRAIDLLENLQEAYRVSINKISQYMQSKSVPLYRHSMLVKKIAAGIYSELPEAYIEIGCTEEKICNAALNQDIGKCLLDNSLLNKSAPPTPEESEIVETHVLESVNILEPLMLKGELEMIYCHHEKLDGSGYPRRLVEDQIPFGAKILAVADAFSSAVNYFGDGEAKDEKVVFKELLNLSQVEYKKLIPKKTEAGKVLEAYFYDRVIVDALIKYWAKCNQS
jgi:HD-GYP domain-containing protein (c-di-GMP phosphodiesterase class II)